MIGKPVRWFEMTGIEYEGKRIPCRLIIFDKDGTLIDFVATWVPLIRKRVSFVLKTLGRNDQELGAHLLKSWGIDPTSGKVDPRGPCPVSPRSDEIVIGTMVLYQKGYPWDEAKEWVSQALMKRMPIVIGGKRSCLSKASEPSSPD
jgi:phosphoglycolate phosphatase